MNQTQFKIYSSSAGSGKTYTLTKEYLKLALRHHNPHYFKAILAITFTNDAANEMKSRIIDVLRNFVLPTTPEKDRQKAEALFQSIAEELRESLPTIRERAEKLFAKILYNYADFAVSTIDKFVNKVTSAFTRELEIPYNYEVDLNTEQLLQNAIDRVIEKVGQEQKVYLSGFVVDWVNQKVEEGKNSGKIAEDLVTFSKELMNENAYPFIQLIKHLDIQDFKRIYIELEKFQREIEYKMTVVAKRGQRLIDDSGAEDKDFAGGSKGIFSYFTHYFENPDITRTVGAFVQNALNDGTFVNKKSKRPQVVEAIDLDLQNIVKEMEDLKETNKGQYLLINSLKPHLYKLALVHEIEQELSQVKRENNTIHISDTNKKIAEIIRQEPVPYIYERVGEKYNHLLIDEFQDTSILQWHNLMPLVENNLSEGHFNLIVGDSKQAIYRWRGGEMEQLVYLYKNEMHKLLELEPHDSDILRERYMTLQQNYERANLNYNYRSTREVIEFNNDFFQKIVDTDFGKIYELLPAIYDEEFAQKVPAQGGKAGGHIQINFLEKGNLYQQQALEKILKIIKELETDNFKPNDIAILVRNNISGSLIANFLTENGYKVISQDSLTLVSDEKIRFIMSLLKVIYRPEDRLSKAEILYSFYRVVKGQNPNEELNAQIQNIVNQPIMALFDKLNEEGYAVHLAKLQSLNLYELAETLIGIFDLLVTQTRLEYLFRLLDIILEFTKQNNATLGDFIDYWEQNKSKLSVNSPPNVGAITVTTIHKSKGLEYPAVILPFMDFSFEPKIGSNMWVTLPESAFSFEFDKQKITLSAGLVSMVKALEETPVALQYHSEMQKTFIENLNILYVAFTRPVHRLYILSKKDDFDKSSGQKRVGYLLFLYLVNSGHWNPDKAEYVLQQGKPLPAPQATTDEEDDGHTFWVDELVITDAHKKLKIRKRGKQPKDER
jgi:ATP-dependent exoDNAse (exonuclease V) beta subunit